MFKEVLSSSLFIVLIVLLAELALSAPQGYNYYANQQRNYYAQRAAQAQRIQAERIQAERIQAQRIQAQRIQAQRIAEQKRHYHQQSYRTTTTRKPYKVSRADSENAKFLGLQNQEPVESSKTFRRRAKKIFGAGYGPGYGAGNGCHFRNDKKQNPEGEGRFFWDLNVYNVYPNGGCGGGGGFPGGYDEFPGSGGYGGSFADPIYGGRPVRGFFQNWLGLFLPGGALSGVNRPYQGSSQSQQSGSQTEPADYDATLGGTGSGGDSSTNAAGSSDNAEGGGDNNAAANNAGMANLTPGQLVSGVANTVNNVIQTLSNTPVYG